MPTDPTNPQVGDLVFNGEEFASYIVDLPPGALQGMLTAQAGLKDVLEEMRANQAEWGAKAGVTTEDAAKLEETNARIARVDVFLPAVAKFLEMLHETRYQLEDKRQRLVLNAALSAERRGKEHPELLAKYEKTRVYRSAAGKKAAKTRRKKAEQAAAAGAGVPAPNGATPA